jgi:hypothetical protein
MRCCMRSGALAVLALLGATLLRPQESPSVEYQLKAAFLLNFARFVQWPSDAFASEKTVIRFCVFKHDPFGSALDEVIRGKSINDHAFVVKRTDDLAELQNCQLVFVSVREAKFLPEILASLKGVSALVVGEVEDFAEHGGAIEFFLENNKLRFAVNVDAIGRARLQASSKLLALARIVHDGGHPKRN